MRLLGALAPQAREGKMKGAAAAMEVAVAVFKKSRRLGRALVLLTVTMEGILFFLEARPWSASPKDESQAPF